jgi:hypothetical protein
MGNNNNLPTLKDIRNAHTWKRNYERYLPLSRYAFRPIGFVMTWSAIRIRLTTESVSWLSGLAGLLGYMCLLSPQFRMLPFGIAILLIFNLLDCVDGSIARTMKTENPYGRFLDSIMVWIDLGFWALIGIMAYRHPYLLRYPDPFGQSQIFWLAVGGMASYFSILANYIEMIFDRSAREAWDEINNTPNIDTGKIYTEGTKSVSKLKKSSQLSLRRIIVIINHNLRVRETHYLLLILAFAFNLIDFFLIVFLFFYFSLSIMLVFIYCRRCRYLRDMAA